MCRVNTKVVTAVEISGWTAHDTNYFVPLVERTAQHFEVREVSADKAYRQGEYLCRIPNCTNIGSLQRNYVQGRC
jgi:hypothetical protein